MIHYHTNIYNGISMVNRKNIMGKKKKTALPKGCHQSSGSHCQTSYHSNRSTGSRAQDLWCKGQICEFLLFKLSRFFGEHFTFYFERESLSETYAALFLVDFIAIATL